MTIKARVVTGTVIILLVIGLLVFFLGPVLFASIAYPLPDKYRGSIVKWTKEYCGNVADAPNLLAGLIMTESGWRENARSSTGAVGMTQFTQSTARSTAARLGVSPFTPNDLINNSDLSIRFGAYYVCARINDYGGNVQKGLIAYNGGGGAVNAFTSGRPIRATVAYANKILALQKAYTNIYGRWWENPVPSSNSTEFNVTPKTDVSLITTVPIIDFWQGLLSNQDTGSSDTTEDSGNLNNLWKVFLPSQ